MTLFESILLQENKDRFIKALKTDEDWKNKAIDFFKSHANLESKIDWNKKNDDLIVDISLLMSTTGEKAEKNKEKRKVYKEAPTFGEGWKIFKETEDWIFAMPLTWEACNYADSTECGGEGAKWCIGYNKDDMYFNRYVFEEGCAFLMAFNKAYSGGVSPDSPWPTVCTKGLKYMIQIEEPDKSNDEKIHDIEVWIQIDEKISNEIKLTTGNWDYYAQGYGYDSNEYNFTEGFWPEITGQELTEVYNLYWKEILKGGSPEERQIFNLLNKFEEICGEYGCSMNELASKVVYHNTGGDPFCLKSDNAHIIDKNDDRVIFWIDDPESYKTSLWQNFNGSSIERMFFYEFFEKICQLINGYKVLGATTKDDLFYLKLNPSTIKKDPNCDGAFIFEDIEPEGFTFIYGDAAEGYDMDYNTRIANKLENELNYKDTELTRKIDMILNS